MLFAGSAGDDAVKEAVILLKYNDTGSSRLM
jgi:hypothetical protein